MWLCILDLRVVVVRCVISVGHVSGFGNGESVVMEMGLRRYDGCSLDLRGNYRFEIRN